METIDIKLPTLKRGRRSEHDKQIFNNELEAFCQEIKKINSRLDFPVSSRGWCYLLEEYGLNKGDFDRAQKLINNCRKSGHLPSDICAEDVTRTIEGVQEPHNNNINSYASEWVDYLLNNVSYYYTPYYFTDFQDYYIELLVEKIDLKGIFGPVCDEYKIPYANSKGWADINSRVSMMRRFQKWEERGKICVLLYCGDHDPGGLIISDTIRSNLNDLVNAVGWDPENLIIDRFGLNYDFIQNNNLTWVDNLETGSGGRLDDPRHNDHYKPYVQSYLQQFGVRKVEANALVTRVSQGRELYENAILKYINPVGIGEYRNATQTARELLQEEIKEIISRS